MLATSVVAGAKATTVSVKVNETQASNCTCFRNTFAGNRKKDFHIQSRWLGKKLELVGKIENEFKKRGNKTRFKNYR